MKSEPTIHTHAVRCAGELLDVIPLVMRSIRAEMRSHRSADLSVPQFRALAFAGINRGATLSDLAGHLGLMPPAVSRIVDGLVVSGLMERRANISDRRCVSLALTANGRKKLQRTTRMAKGCLAEIFAPLSVAECGQISSVMRKLKELF